MKRDLSNLSRSDKINRVRKDDEGFFECQISTAPLVGRSIFLKVIGRAAENWPKLDFNYGIFSFFSPEQTRKSEFSPRMAINSQWPAPI